ncbi:hypothetical protein [Ruminococcus flavefaciens]|uniref:hypothetical protein n=1 Tax=Ruminococcus flavefaciens TaxID=1265 RepID=UPI00036A832F|nr:hypothetical protein [Ruminococcus flavefaciens]
MKKPRILVMSVQDAVKYVLKHIQYEYAQKTDTYAVISIQDTEGFGIEFRDSSYCKDVLTLYFDDLEESCPGYKMINDAQAEQIIHFIKDHQDVDTLLIHCYAGVSRSRAVGVFASELLGIPFSSGRAFNEYVYSMLKDAVKEIEANEESSTIISE